MAVSVSSLAQVRIAITIAPPALPIYEQPACPGDGYLWTPGYRAYDYDQAFHLLRPSRNFRPVYENLFGKNYT